MKDVYSPPFQRLGQALAYYNNCNPARELRVNILEPDRIKRPILEDFSGDSSKDIWCSVAGAIGATLEGKPGDHIIGWSVRNLGPSSLHMAIEDIAKLLGMNDQAVRRFLGKINRELEQELRRRHLIPWEVERYLNGRMKGKKRHIIAVLSEDTVALGFDSVRIEPSESGDKYELVGYAGSDRQDAKLAIYPAEGATVVTKDEISRKFA